MPTKSERLASRCKVITTIHSILNVYCFRCYAAQQQKVLILEMFTLILIVLLIKYKLTLYTFYMTTTHKYCC